jgi:hypothetical protein
MDRPDGIEFITEGENGAENRFVKFSEMDNGTLTNYIMKYPVAMTEWMNRLDEMEKQPNKTEPEN